MKASKQKPEAPLATQIIVIIASLIGGVAALPIAVGRSISGRPFFLQKVLSQFRRSSAPLRPEVFSLKVVWSVLPLSNP